MSAKSDAALIGDRVAPAAAFEQVVLRHHAVVYGYVARRLGPSVAEDIASEVFAIAFARRRSYDSAYPDARPWLLGIATNLIRRHTKREADALRAFAASGVDPIAPPDPEGDPTLRAALAGALAAMPRRHRDVLFLHAVGDLSHEQIAAALGVPVGTVKGWLHRARSRAAKELAMRGVGAAGSSHPEPRVVER